MWNGISNDYHYLHDFSSSVVFAIRSKLDQDNWPGTRNKFLDLSDIDCETHCIKYKFNYLCRCKKLICNIMIRILHINHTFKIS